jgi:hypothetical protein
MSHPHHPARDDDARDGRPGDGQNHLTLSRTGPQRPEAGSPLERVLRRQVAAPGTGRLLGFVPAQVR